MNKANQLLTKILEILSSSYDYDHDEDSYNHKHTYTFSTDKRNEYQVHVQHTKLKNGVEANVHFADEDGNTDINNNEKGSAHKVLGTVVKILKDHSKKYPEVNPYNFSGDTNHAPLYRKMAKKLAYTHTEEGDHNFGDDITHFSIKKSDIK